ncbi:conserved hypothetical protein [Histoplasma capsulatum var. duboisii H88]|uniref:MADS-box domain-containing protein n=1 Tax=Ajellomyces capsulatus (strain H88) TaxID=544711 RepID=F0U9P9_AJEC8|nr:conserved hypothetical protein [Histoplasma capsulatum var. duboisii H88]QSS51641.1 hypothetical protein I7I53_07009 [Histoplasma capsulatum var. duboisii H88]
MAGRYTFKRRDRKLAHKDHDPRKKAKADRERFRRGRDAIFAKAQAIYQDAHDNGRERFVSVVILDKKVNSPGKYFVYNSHSTKLWPPSKEQIDEHYPLTEYLTPEDFDDKNDKNEEKEQKEMLMEEKRSEEIKLTHMMFKIESPPTFNLSTELGEY